MKTQNLRVAFELCATFASAQFIVPINQALSYKLFLNWLQITSPMRAGTITNFISRPVTTYTRIVRTSMRVRV